MVRTRQPTIDHAIDKVEDELTIATKEREAFTRFLTRVRDVDAVSPNTGVGTAGEGSIMYSVAGPSSSDSLAEVRTAYRETVMAVPHYDQEYGDTLPKSLCAEFGETLAGQLVNGQVLVPALYDALLEAIEASRDDRDQFVRLLKREQASLQDVATELNGIESRLLELSESLSSVSTSEKRAEIDESLAILECKCTNLANERQERIHGRSVSILSGVEENSLVQYLYGDMETVAPALTDIASCLDTIRHQRRHCL